MTEEQRPGEYAEAVAACPTPAYHETHRYCPSCPWTEMRMQSDCGPMRPMPSRIEALATYEQVGWSKPDFKYIHAHKWDDPEWRSPFGENVTSVPANAPYFQAGRAVSAVSNVGEVIQNSLRKVYGFDNVDWCEDDENTLGVVTSDGQFVEISMHECYSAGITRAPLSSRSAEPGS